MISDLSDNQWKQIARQNAMLLNATQEKLKQAIIERNACRECARRLMSNVPKTVRDAYLKTYPEVDY